MLAGKCRRVLPSCHKQRLSERISACRATASPSGAGVVHEASTAQTPVVVNLANQRIYRGQDGVLHVPILSPDRDALPFAMALLLIPQHMAADNVVAAASHSDSAVVNDELFELIYVLEGNGEMLRSDGTPAAVLRMGDSVVAPCGSCRCHSMTTSQHSAAAAAADSCNESWSMAALCMVMPADIISSADDGQRLKQAQHAAARVHDAWMRGVHTGMLQPHAIDTILTAASRHAKLQSHSVRHIADADSAAMSSMSPQHAAAHLLSSLNGIASQRAELWKAFVEQLTSTPARVGNLVAAHSSQNAFGTLRNSFRDATRGVQTWLWNIQGNCPVRKRALQDASAYQLPNQTNRLALVFDPTREDVQFTFGVEIFEPSHRTQPHVHNHAHELFFILSGSGTAFCDGRRFEVAAGDTIVFPPGTVHGIDNAAGRKMYCLELMLPNEMFAEFVKRGTLTRGLDGDDACILMAQGCSNALADD